MDVKKYIKKEVKTLFEAVSLPIIKRKFYTPELNEEEDEFSHMTYEDLVRAAGVTLEMALKKRWHRADLIQSIKKWENRD
jgi:hypothetical protein